MLDWDDYLEIHEHRRQFPDYLDMPDDMPIAGGGELTVPWLLAAYSLGVFPWFAEDGYIEWWNTSPRCLLLPEDYHLPQRAKRKIRQYAFHLTLDEAFSDVIRLCGELRERKEGTWISPDIYDAYTTLHKAGFAHSVEAWRDGRLVGGLYGVALGRIFCGESMFHIVDEASRACLAGLARLCQRRGIRYIDCQMATEHVLAQGAKMYDREDFFCLRDESLSLDRESEDALTQEHRESLRLWPFLPWSCGKLHCDTESWNWE